MKFFVCIFLALTLQFNSPINSGTITEQQIEYRTFINKTNKNEASTSKKEAAVGKIRQELINEVDSYIKSDFPSSRLDGGAIVDMCIKYDIDPVFILAQGRIESGFGTAGRAKKTNSVWNVGAHDGRPVHKSNTFAHPNQSIEPYIVLIKEKYLGERKTVHDLMTNYVSLGGHRYASTRQYESILKREYERIRKTTRIYEFFNML